MSSACTGQGAQGRSATTLPEHEPERLGIALVTQLFTGREVPVDDELRDGSTPADTTS
jgi:hypothetical protein